MSIAELETTPDLGVESLTPAAACTMLADFVEVLLPGGAGWPSGRDAGIQALLALRLLDQQGKAAFPTLVKALLAAGAPLGGRSEPERIAIVQKFEADEPALFGWIRDAAYIAYYENPFVGEVINAKGTPYELRPHIKGYNVQRFDLERQTPRHGRGHFIPTDQVKKIDVSGLDLASERTQNWGLKR